MSLFNFNPSSFLGSGAFTLDPSKFNFSNISYSAPKPVDDPVAIVSDKTPDTEVEILEGAGTVAITEKTPEPDPIEEAIKTVVPQETPVKSGVKPVPVPQPEAPTQPETVPESANSFSGLTDAQRAEMNQKIDEINKYGSVQSVSKRYGLGSSGASQADLEQANQYIQWNNARTDISEEEKQKVNEGILYTQVTQEGVDQRNPLVTKLGQALTIGLVTGGVGFGGSIASATGLSTASGTALANAAVTLGRGESLDVGELAATVVGAEIADYADNIEAMAEVNEVTKELQAQADILKNVSNVAEVAQAVKSGNVVKAISGGLELAGMDNLVDYTQRTIENLVSETELGDVGNAVANWAFNNSAPIAEATLDFLETAVKTGDLKEAGVDAVIEYFEEGGGLSDLVPEGSGIDLEVPEVVKEVAQVIADGASAVNREVIKPIVNKVEEVGQGVFEAVEEVAGDVKQTYKEEIEPYIEREFDDFKDYYKTEIEPSIEQGINDVKQELADFDDSTLQPAKDTIIETAENIENYYKTEIEPSIEQGIKDVKEELARFDENVLQPIKETTESVLESVDEKLGEFDDEVLQPIKDDIVAVANSVDQGLSDFNKDVIKPALQSIEDRLSAIDVDTSGLEKMIKGLFNMINFGNVANQTMTQIANRPTFEKVDLTNVELLTPEVVEGFEYDDLSNKLLA